MQTSMRRPAAVKVRLRHLALRSSPLPRTGPQPRFHSHSSWTRSGSGACWGSTGKRRCHLHSGLVWRSTATVLGPSLRPQSSLPGRLVLGFFGAGISSCLYACSTSTARSASYGYSSWSSVASSGRPCSSSSGSGPNRVRRLWAFLRPANPSHSLRTSSAGQRGRSNKRNTGRALGL